MVNVAPCMKIKLMHKKRAAVFSLMSFPLLFRVDLAS